MRLRKAEKLVWLGVLALPLVAAGQLAPSTDVSPVSHAPAAPVVDEDEPVATLKVDVTLVNVFFTVKDKAGLLVPHLSKNDCSVAEDNVPQTLKGFVAETSQPLTLGLMLDTSGSQGRILPLEQQIGGQFLQRVLRQKDEAFLISFDVNVDLLQDYTNSSSRLTRAMNEARINTGGGGGTGIPGAGGGTVPTPGGPRGTVLFDAVYLAVQEKMRQETGRKALILLTDGADQGSRIKIGEAIAAAQKSNVIVYVILVMDRAMYTRYDRYGNPIMLGYGGYSAMKKLTEETGGRLIDVGDNAKKLEAAFAQIEEELRTQYVASYTPTNPKQDGSFRKLTVTCQGDGMKVQSRKGYYAMPGAQ